MARKKSETPVGTYPLKLTPHQREAVLTCAGLKKTIKQRIEQAGDGTQTIAVTREELDHLHAEIGETAVYAKSPHKKRLFAVLWRIADMIEAAEDAASGAVTPAANRRPARTTDQLYQFKITLLDISPAIWRRIQVPDCSLNILHHYIQAAFGWENYHLHQFEIGGVRYGPPEPDDMGFDMETEDESAAVLSGLLPKSKRKTRWIYEYDFGDGWRHDVLFEGAPPADPKVKYPRCVDGARACPPEDCGGPWGYADYLAAVADPEHEQHEEMLEWRGSFDPKAFDPRKATKEMRAVP